MELATERLLLDALRMDDAEALYACRGDARVARFQGWRPVSVAEAADFIRRQHDETSTSPGSNAPAGWFQRAIRDRCNGQLMGDLGLCLPADEDGSVEFGISIATPFQGRGYGSEALRAVFAWVFEVQGRHRVHASVDPRNLASMAMLRSLGMRQEAHFRESLRLHGEWVDDMIFALLAREWLDWRLNHTAGPVSG
jgi:RimJ/RimL family protein N-acetyltransferase